MNQQQLQELALAAISADCAKTIDDADSEKTREATQHGTIELSDGTSCFLVSTDNLNIVVSRTMLTEPQRKESAALAKKITGFSQTEFVTN